MIVILDFETNPGSVFSAYALDKKLGETDIGVTTIDEIIIASKKILQRETVFGFKKSFVYVLMFLKQK